MKIAFTGKGGSGKTTTSALFAKVAATDGFTVLALDADINQHLAGALGCSGDLRSMGAEAEVIKTYLRGANNYIPAQTMHKTSPPGYGSQLLHVRKDDWFMTEFAKKHEHIWLAGAGEIPEGNVGVRCYHGLNGAVELVLGHLIDQQDDLVIVDMTAGADAFSSSLFTKVDALVLVVEPTLKSLSVYAQFKGHAAKYGVPLVVVANKVDDQEDREFIAEHIDHVAIWLSSSRYVRNRERGSIEGDMENEIIRELRVLRTMLLSSPIDWHKREALSHRMHRRAVEDPHIDPDFSLAKAAL